MYPPTNESLRFCFGGLVSRCRVYSIILYFVLQYMYKLDTFFGIVEGVEGRSYLIIAHGQFTVVLPRYKHRGIYNEETSRVLQNDGGLGFGSRNTGV